MTIGVIINKRVNWGCFEFLAIMKAVKANLRPFLVLHIEVCNSLSWFNEGDVFFILLKVYPYYTNVEAITAKAEIAVKHV